MNHLNTREWYINEPTGELHETLLHMACRHGKLDIVRTLIEIYGCNYNAIDKYGNTAGHVACENGHTEILAYFYHSSCSSMSLKTNNCGETWLHSASKSNTNSKQLVRFIAFLFIRLENKSKFKLVDFNDDILWFLFYRNNFVKLQLSIFEDFFVPDDYGLTPLHVACKQNNFELMKLFLTELSFVLNVDIKQYIPSTLTLACELRRYDIVKYLSAYLTCPLFSCPRVGLMSKWDTTVLHGKKNMSLPNESAIFLAARRGDQELFSKLIHNFNILFYTVNEYEDTLLHAACVSCDLTMVKLAYQVCVRNSFNINAKNLGGNTCLHIACRWGSFDVANFLIEKQCSINENNLENESPLHLAIRNKSKSVFNLLLADEQADLNEKNINGETPLHVASCDPEGIYYVEKLLDDRRCNSINEQDNYGDTPLFNACRTMNKKMMFYLLNKKCDILSINHLKNETVASIACRFHWTDVLEKMLSSETTEYPSKLQNYLGQTLIHTACWKKNFELMKFLINKCKSYCPSEDINLLDSVYELTPLQFACTQNDKKVLQYLLDLHGCFADTKNKEGNTVLHICSSFNLFEMAKLCINYCSLTVRNENGNSPLHLACFNKNFELLSFLINSLPKYCKIDKCINKDGKNVLHVVASQEGTLNILKYMVDSGKHDVYCEDRYGNTALHFAFQNGVLENAQYLLTVGYKEEFWLNKKGDSPLSLAIEDEKYEFVKSIWKSCLDIMILKCYSELQPSYLYFPHTVQFVQMPLSFFLVYSIKAKNHDDQLRFTDEQRKKYNSIIDLICTLIIDKRFRGAISKLRDSKDNTILHYICMCNYNDKLDKVADSALLMVDVNSINKNLSTPIHYACSSPQDWMICKLFDYDESKAFETLSIKSFSGTPLNINCRSQFCNQYLSTYLVAHGAGRENLVHSACRSDKENSYSIGIFVLGNSGVGKTTLVDTLRMRITDSSEPKKQEGPTTGLVRNEYVYYKNKHRYIFYDFAGQVEFETNHSVYLENLLSSEKRKNPFIFLMVVKGTDSFEENVKQINRWVMFIQRHARINAKGLHIMLICSHDDHIESISDKKMRINALKRYLAVCDTAPLEKHENPILLNGTIADTSPVKVLMQYLEEMFISCERYEDCQTTDELYVYIERWFGNRPVRVKEFVKKMKENRSFSLDHHNYKIIVNGSASSMIIPSYEPSLVEYLNELVGRNNILLLKPSDGLDWWIVGKKVHNDLSSTALSLFSPRTFSDSPNYSLNTYNTGVVPKSKIREAYSKILKLDLDLIISYLESMEFCKKISKDIAEIIGALNSDEDEILYFFPGLIKTEKDEHIFKESNSNCMSGWLVEKKQNWGLRFLNILLLRLTYEFSTQKSQYYSRRIHLWKKGLFLCTRNESKLLVELMEETKLCVVCHCSSNLELARLRSKILYSIKELHSKQIQAIETNQITQYILYPPPKSYSSIKDSTSIPLKEVTKCFSCDIDSRTYYVSDEECVRLDKLLCFDPYIHMNKSMIKQSKSEDIVRLDSLHETIRNLPDFQGEISHRQLHNILQNYSVFRLENLLDQLTS